MQKPTVAGCTFPSVESRAAPITLVFLLSVLLIPIPDYVFVLDSSVNVAILIGTCLIMSLPFAPSFFLYILRLFCNYCIGGKR